jgi:hypothetical protein
LSLNLVSVQADEPHMRRALEHLRAARAGLQSAEHDKGGRRVRGLQNSDRAIREAERNMTFAR